jgi:hypothetical protein
MNKSFHSRRQLKREKLRKFYGNPWDNSEQEKKGYIEGPARTFSPRKRSQSSSPRKSSPNRSVSSKHPKKSALKKSSGTRKNVSFKHPLTRSKSTTSSSHAAWRSVSSK